MREIIAFSPKLLARDLTQKAKGFWLFVLVSNNDSCNKSLDLSLNGKNKLIKTNRTPKIDQLSPSPSRTQENSMASNKNSLRGEMASSSFFFFFFGFLIL